MNPSGRDESKAFLHKLNPYVCLAQTVLSFSAGGLAVWSMVTVAKKVFLSRPDTGMYPWTFIYFRPAEYDLPNYFILCVFMGLAGLVIYLLDSERRLLKRAGGTNPLVALLTLAASAALLAAQYEMEGKWRLSALSAVAVLPFITLYRTPGKRLSPWVGRETAFLAGAAVLVFLFQMGEVTQFFFRPVYLLNELPQVYSGTKIKNGEKVAGVVKNDQYLAGMGSDELHSVFLFFDIYARLNGESTEYLLEDNIEFLNKYRFQDLRLPQAYIVELINANKPGMVNLLINSREYRQSISVTRDDIERYLDPDAPLIDPFPFDGFRVKGLPEKSMSMKDICWAAYNSVPPGMEPGLEAVSYYDPPNMTYPFGAYICVMNIDVDTGVYKIRRFYALDDCGTRINPMIIEGQVHGGLTEAFAIAMGQEIRYDEGGNVVTGSFMDFFMPTAVETPHWETDFTVTPSPHHPIGAKGVGESPNVGGVPAFSNAVNDAFSFLGSTHIQMPHDYWRNWRAAKNLGVFA